MQAIFGKALNWNINGYDLTKTIKKYNPNLPIIAQTSYSFTEDKERVFKAGCDDYISKPLDKKTFLSKINVLLSKGK